MKVPRSAAQELWEKASPLSWTRPDVPPFFVVEGALDTLVWREEAQRFVGELRDVSESAVGYAEVPDAQHAFDVLMNRRSIHTVRAVTAFMEAVRDGRVR
jgi:acetyl esterase/lipase